MVLLVGSVVHAERLAAQQPLAFGGWQLFEYFSGVGPVDGTGFSFSSSQQIRVRVTETGFSGDAFDLFANGVLVFGTPSVAGGVDTQIFTPDAAWLSPDLSRGEFYLNPGSYTLTLSVRETGSGFDDGEGFLRADVMPSPPTTVPEPSTIVFAGAGMLAVFAMGRRRVFRSARRSA